MFSLEEQMPKLNLQKQLKDGAEFFRPLAESHPK